MTISVRMVLGAAAVGLAAGAALAAPVLWDRTAAEDAWQAPPAPLPARQAQAVLNLLRQTGHFAPVGSDEAAASEAEAEREEAQKAGGPRVLAVAHRDGALVVYVADEAGAKGRLHPVSVGERTLDGYELIGARGGTVLFQRGAEQLTVALYSGAEVSGLGAAH